MTLNRFLPSENLVFFNFSENKIFIFLGDKNGQEKINILFFNCIFFVDIKYLF